MSFMNLTAACIVFVSEKYEVHPMPNGGYGVVAVVDGDVVCSFATQTEAVKVAREKSSSEDCAGEIYG